VQTFIQVAAAVGFGLALAVLVGTLAGCAPQTFTGICAMKPIGQESGVAYVMAYCEAKE
jgi:hypothetical protein